MYCLVRLYIRLKVKFLMKIPLFLPLTWIMEQKESLCFESRPKRRK